MENYLFGIRPLIEYLKEGKTPEKVMIQKGIKGSNFNELFSLIREKQIPFQWVPIEKLNRITKSNHQGIIAFAGVIEYASLEKVLPGIYEDGQTPLLIILDRITDVRNMGAIARSAECAGVQAMILGKKSSAPINADAIKTSAGALSRLPVCREDDLMETIAFLKESGIKVVASSEKAEKTIYESDMTGPIAMVMGSEDKGISKILLTMADEIVSIPQKGKTGSLNVSVAAGIVLFEANRQRG